MKDETFNKESVGDVDSLLIEIRERAKSITVENFPDPNKLTFVKEHLKKSNDTIFYLDLESSHLLMEIARQYFFASVSNNTELIEYIKAKLNPFNNTYWFFDLDEILTKLNEIEETGKFKVDVYNCLRNIFEFISVKIISSLIVTYNERIGTSKEPLNVERLRNHQETKQKALRENRHYIVNGTTLAAEKVLELTKVVFSNKMGADTDFKMASRFINGKVESKYLNPIYSDFIMPIGVIENGEKELVVYNLFQMLCKDLTLHKTLDDYELSQESTPNGFNRYKKAAIRRIMRLK